MQNPLTIEERVSLFRLIGHDLATHHNHLIEKVTGQRDNLTVMGAVAKFEIVRNVFTAMSTMGGENNPYVYVMRPGSWKGEFEDIKPLYDGKVTVNLDVTSPIKTRPEVVNVALNNLIKNGLHFGNAVTVSATDYSGEVPNPVYVPGAHESERFVKFTVHDNGPGFPKGHDPKEFLELNASTREDSTMRGFGLYFVSLACKFLRSPLTIESEPGDTKISIYHPTNLR